MRAIVAVTLVSTTLATTGCELLLTPRDELVGTRDGGVDGPSLVDGGGVCDADLTKDEKNCGACGHECCEGACVDSKCAVVQLGSGGEPRAIELDDTSIYWFDRADGTIRGRPKSKVGPEKTLWTGTPGEDIGQIAVDGAFVYFTTATAVMRAPTTPGSATTVLGGLSGAWSAATWSGYVYYALTNAVRRVRFDGTGDEPVATLPNAGPQLLVAPPSLYLTPKMVRVPLLGGANEGPGFDTAAVAAAADDVWALQVLPSTRVALVRLDVATLTPKTLTDVAGAGGVTTDGAHVWIGDFGTGANDGAIVRYDADGKNRTVVAGAQTRPAGLRSDAKCIYWSNPFNDGRVLKVAK